MYNKKTVTIHGMQPNQSVHVTFNQHGIMVQQPGSSKSQFLTTSVASKPAPAAIAMPKSPTTFQSANNVMPTATDSPILTVLPPFPPNWHERYQNTVASLQNFKLFPIEANTSEFAVIASLMDPAIITSVEQVVNPSLWSRFVNTRKEMLKSKSNDFELLSKLGLTEADLMTCYQQSVNFDTTEKVSAVPYNDNMALLFHCTRNPENIKDILRQGLDERMGSTEGLLGKGIYFTDNPAKSIRYDGCGGVIFIFAVLLGDSLAVGGQMKTCVREPEKRPKQKRNLIDLFFDSIVGQPAKDRDNEYVIYNRYQCCPLYKIQYSPGSYTGTSRADSGIYVESRKYYPPMAWRTSDHRLPEPIQKSWPFFAGKIFAKMEENGGEKERKRKERKKEIARARREGRIVSVDADEIADLGLVVCDV